MRQLADPDVKLVQLHIQDLPDDGRVIYPLFQSKEPHMDQSLAVVSETGALVVRPAEALQQLKELQAVVKEVMVLDEHYGVIPGSKKPSLLKPGAELLCTIYGLRVADIIILEKTEQWDVPVTGTTFRKLVTALSSAINTTAVSLMDRFWPGPLTLVFPAEGNLSGYLTAGTQTVAVRIPGESFALQLAQSAQFPLTATSANISGKPPAVDAEAVIEYFNAKIDLLIDGGRTPGGSPSTIVDVTGETIRILREGALKKEYMAAYFMPG